MNDPELVVSRVRPTKPADTAIEGIPESAWSEVCAYLSKGVKINDALDDLFIPVSTYRLAMSQSEQLRERVAAARAVWDDRNWPEELILSVFHRVSGGASLKDVAAELGFEPQGFHALRLRDSYVNESYEMALQIQTEGLVDEMRAIVDETSQDALEDGRGGFRANGAAPQRDRLRFEMRKWAASKLIKKYGDKIDLDLSVDVRGNLAERLDGARRRKEAVHAQLIPADTNDG